GISKACSDVPPIGSAAADAVHVLDEHQFLMPCAIVMHDGEHRELVMGRRPEDTRRVVEIAVALNIDHNSIAALRSQRSTDTSRSAVAHAARALSAKVAVGLVVIPKLRIVSA